MEWEYFFYEITETEFQNSSLLTEEHISLTAQQEFKQNLKRNYKQHQKEIQMGKAKV